MEIVDSLTLCYSNNIREPINEYSVRLIRLRVIYSSLNVIQTIRSTINLWKYVWKYHKLYENKINLKGLQDLIYA